MNLLEQSQQNVKKNNNETQSIDCIINSIKPTRDAKRVTIQSNIGTFWAFPNQFEGGIPSYIPSTGIKSNITLIKKVIEDKEYINILNIKAFVLESKLDLIKQMGLSVSI